MAEQLVASLGQGNCLRGPAGFLLLHDHPLGNKFYSMALMLKDNPLHHLVQRDNEAPGTRYDGWRGLATRESRRVIFTSPNCLNLTEGAARPRGGHGRA